MFACALTLSADPADTTNALPQKIGTGDAAKYYDKEMTVTGLVAQVTFHQNVVYLNLDKQYPDTPFAIAIFPKDSKKFGHLFDFYGKNVEATGKIKNYHDKPVIILDNTNELKVVSPETQ
jgi:hypothetical protein